MKILILTRRFTNFSYRFLDRFFGNRPVRLLDVGSGNRSASRLTAVFPRCLYYGLDQNKAYNYDASDFRRMEQFYEIDLSKLQFGALVNAHFDAIWMVHVIEHLPNGEAVVRGLFEKLKPGGYFYIEYPGKRSTKLPSMYGCVFTGKKLEANIFWDLLGFAEFLLVKKESGSQHGSTRR